jgi:hypothetical protein
MKIAPLAAAALVLSSTAEAQERREMNVSDLGTWQHKWTELRLPPQVDGFRRRGIADYSEDERNVIGSFDDAESGTHMSLYIYQAAITDVSLWQDRVAHSMRANDRLGRFDSAGAIGGTFTPASADGHDSGYRLAGPLTGGTFRSTGFQMFAHDGWLVKIRMSSEALSPAELIHRMEGFMATLALSPGKVDYPAVRLIADCTAPIRFGKARRVKPDLATLLLVAAAAGAAGRKQDAGGGGQAVPAGDPDYCRDAATTPGYGVYRAGGAADGYVIAFGDAGVSATVGRNDLAALMGGSNYWIALSEPARTLFYAPYSRLPAPEEVMRAVSSEGPVTSATMDSGGNSTVTLPTGG